MIGKQGRTLEAELRPIRRRYQQGVLLVIAMLLSLEKLLDVVDLVRFLTVRIQPPG